MSRIGKRPIEIPSGVKVSVEDINLSKLIKVEGPLGKLSEKIDLQIGVEIQDNVINVTRENDLKRSRSLHGLSRTLIANMVEGVSKGFEKKLEIVGVGYRAEKKGKVLDLHLGFSHDLLLEDPNGITTEVPSPNEILIKGIDKQLVGNYAAKIRSYRKPEPYKGKGIRYAGEYIRRKEGKTAKK